MSASASAAGMVLCAGLGTRLRPLTDLLPKPAVPLCGLPLVRYALALLAGAGVGRALVNVHHLPDAMDASARASAQALGLELAVAREPVITGTGGALRAAREALAGASAIVVMNGDILFDLDVGEALAAHRASGALATMVLMRMPDGARYAAVETDPSGAVRRIAGRFGPGGATLHPWHFTGVHVVSSALLEHIPDSPLELDVNRHVYPPLMASGLVRGHVVNGGWSDLGTPADYLAANRDVLAGRVKLGRFPGASPFAGLVEHLPGAWVAEDAEVAGEGGLRGPCIVRAGARVGAGAVVGPGAVVGERCTVSAGARVENAVLWDETELARGEAVVGAIAAGGLRVGAG